MARSLANAALAHPSKHGEPTGALPLRAHLAHLPRIGVGVLVDVAYLSRPLCIHLLVEQRQPQPTG